MEQYGRDEAYYWHMHHETLVENTWSPKGSLDAGVRERAEYILEDKPRHEVKMRLFLMRPATIPFAAEVYEEVNKIIGQLGKMDKLIQKTYNYKDPNGRGYTRRVKLYSERDALEKRKREVLGRLPWEGDYMPSEETLQLHREQCDPECTWINPRQHTYGNTTPGTIFPPGYGNTDLYSRVQAMTIDQILDSRPYYSQVNRHAISRRNLESQRVTDHAFDAEI